MTIKSNSMTNAKDQEQTRKFGSKDHVGYQQGSQRSASSGEGSQMSLEVTDDYHCSDAIDVIRSLPRSDSWGYMIPEEYEDDVAPTEQENYNADMEYILNGKSVEAIRSLPRADSWGNMDGITESP